MEYSSIPLSLCGLGKEDIVDTFIDYDKQLETAENFDSSTWKSALFICPNCTTLYYTNNINNIIQNITKTTQLDEVIIPPTYENINSFVSFDISKLNQLNEKYTNELKAFYDGEIKDYLTYILNNILQFNLALKQMHSQMVSSNLNKISFSLSFIWFTKPFYTAECTFIPPLNKQDYHTLYDSHLFNYIKDILPDINDVTIEYPELDGNVKSINISNNTELGVEFVLQF
jgi:hypothetical protein